MKRFSIVMLIAVCYYLTVACAREDELLSQQIDDTTIVLNPTSEYIVIFGDIQYYTNATHIGLYQHTISWILRQRSAGININYVLHTGDITQTNSTSQWDAFYSSTIAMAGIIPFYSAIGDHDYNWYDGVHINDRYSTHFNEYLQFPLSVQHVVESYEPGRMENVVVESYIHGVPYYLLILEFGPRKEVVAWADAYVKSHPNIRFIILNHEYLEKGGSRRTTGLKCHARLQNTTYTTPNDLWNTFVKTNDNIVCVLCGHVGGLYALTLEANDFGREVPQIQHNIQSSQYRYDNWVMLWEFPQVSDSVSVGIYNTKTYQWYNNEQVLFKFKYRY